jgi:exosortase E/protease (VPEID-CTERM system)
MIILQIFILKLTIHPKAGNLAGIHTVPGGAFQLLLYLGLGFLLLLMKDFNPVWQTLIRYARPYRWWRAIVPQLGAYILIIYFSSKIFLLEFPFLAGTDGESKAWWALLLAISILAAAGLSLLMIAPASYWRRFLREERYALLLAPAFPLCHLLVFFLAENFDDFLSKPTINIAGFILRAFYENVRIDMPNRMLGISDFSVIIDGMCSGYEGIGMMLVFITWYLATHRKDLRFPAALLLLPLGAVLIWLSNCLRIAALVAIGSSFSSDVAMEGFHVNAGWICFIAVSLLMMTIAGNSRSICKTPATHHLAIDSGNALAIPFLVMLAATLLSSAISTSFPWLYPVRILATGIAISVLWKHFAFKMFSGAPFAILAGAIVFILWIVLVPSPAEENKKFYETLFSAPPLVAIGWIATRLLGAILIVPIAEELAFRAYIPALLDDARNGERNTGKFQWLPFLASSTAFGMLHTAWLAGTIAGAAYYVVKLWNGRLSDAIVAHMTTNLLLSCYILAFGQWSYW